jgi:hypothetical protein
MSYYYDVLEPTVQQQGSHMIMKNVSKTLKDKIVNIDTKYRTDYDYTSFASVNAVFGEKLSEVRSMERDCLRVRRLPTVWVRQGLACAALLQRQS